MKSEEKVLGQGNRLWVSESKVLRNELVWDGGDDGRTSCYDYDLERDLKDRGFLYSLLEFSTVAHGVKEPGFDPEVSLFNSQRINGSYELVILSIF